MPACGMQPGRPLHARTTSLILSSRLGYDGVDEVCLRLIVRLSVMAETIGEHPLERVVLPCSLRMGSQIVVEGEGTEVCLPAVLDDVEVMRVGEPLAEGIPFGVAQNWKERVVQAPQPFNVGIDRAQARHGYQDIDDRLGGQARH
jgi:hypothetical protein